jgi:hypothetical protein
MSERAKRVALAGASGLVAVNIWTGAPLLALWVGSRFVGDSRLSMAAVGIVVVVLAAAVIALVAALGRLSAAYDRISGAPPAPRRTSPWLRSLRSERAEQRVGAIERVIVVSVLVAAIAFNVWFFFGAGSPLPQS